MNPTQWTTLRRVRAGILAAALLLLPSCAGPSPVRVVPRDARQMQSDLDTCALHGDTLSAYTTWLLQLLEAKESYEKDPLGTLVTLHAAALKEVHGPGLFGLAELSYLAAKRLNSRECYLAAAVYAYLFLLPDDPALAPSAYDRHFRWACDIYNRSLAKAFRDPKKSLLRLEPGRLKLPAGALQVEVDTSDFPFKTEGLELLPADDLDVVGLSFRVRDSGLGVPLIAVAKQRGQGTAGVGILDKTSVAATAFLRLRGGLADIGGGLSAVLELHSSSDTASVELAGRTVPLESDLSATVAYGIESADLWGFDLAGLFKSKDASRENGLILPRPFQHGKIPVVFVHGTASNPAYWAEMMNALTAEPEIRSHYQFWLFIYATGNPVVFSAATLRRSLAEVLKENDPEGADPALQRMVIVGHSQGGLLTKLMGVTVDADAACTKFLGAPLAELHLGEEQEKLMRECFDVRPLPYVERLVFLATPHRGSFQAARWYSRLFARLIAVPGEIGSLASQIAGSVPRDHLPPGLEERVPTSLDNMDPGNPVMRYLSDLPIDPRIHAHSIIPIGDAKEPAGADDGVVEYESAHLEGVDSEILVPSGHSCQSHPRTLIEMRRILLAHLAASSKP
jgi:pimeloyl-ACP methyl ester carboxylesterase